ncbi:hypothetical protein I9W82_002295 [Candida metapsilosis]|uniref:Uncharacterized protein n=1 Tax=Candida metapsilosis TaxID=273372 RepID=A0A8H7ZH22_9ASCO|nr:hypothetical protein I9W82_002295 [Candida metapsilosis]
MSKVVTTKSTVQHEPNDDVYSKTVVFVDEDEKQVCIPFPFESSSELPSSDEKPSQVRHSPETPMKQPLRHSETPRLESTEVKPASEQHAQDDAASSQFSPNTASSSTKETSTTASPDVSQNEGTPNNAMMAQLGKEIVELLQESGFVKKESVLSENSRKRRREDDEEEELDESRTYNCELEFDITTEDEGNQEKVEKEGQANDSDEESMDSQFTVALQLVYVFKPEIDLTSIPINLYVTKSELIKYLMDKLVLRQGKDSAATDLYSVQSKIKKLLNLKSVRCWINGYELDI